jgi:hypothetical protein
MMANAPATPLGHAARGLSCVGAGRRGRFCLNLLGFWWATRGRTGQQIDRPCVGGPHRRLGPTQGRLWSREPTMTRPLPRPGRFVRIASPPAKKASPAAQCCGPNPQYPRGRVQVLAAEQTQHRIPLARPRDPTTLARTGGIHRLWRYRAPHRRIPSACGMSHSTVGGGLLAAHYPTDAPGRRGTGPRHRHPNNDCKAKAQSIADKTAMRKPHLGTGSRSDEAKIRRLNDKVSVIGPPFRVASFHTLFVSWPQKAV